jgi:hypothetical protein
MIPVRRLRAAGSVVPLDGYLERARLESASTVVPDGFTARVMRAVGVQRPEPVWFDLLPSMLASGALIMAGAMLLVVSPENSLAAAALLALGLLWTWLDDPFAADLKIRLTPW